MRLDEFYKIADAVAPKALSDEFCAKYNAYDNSGILVDVGEEITGILFSLDLTDAAIEEAIEQNANLIITHHPTIYGKIGKICDEGEGTLGGKLVQCIRNGISVISMHLNLDTAPDGIDESLMQGIALCAETNGVGTSFMKDIEYWIWLSRIEGLNPKILNNLLEIPSKPFAIHFGATKFKNIIPNILNAFSSFSNLKSSCSTELKNASAYSFL